MVTSFYHYIIIDVTDRRAASVWPMRSCSFFFCFFFVCFFFFFGGGEGCLVWLCETGISHMVKNNEFLILSGVRDISNLSVTSHINCIVAR